MSQTSVNEQGLALNGQKYALLKDSVLSYAAEGRVPFGRHVSLGTDKDLQGKLPVAAGSITDIKLSRGPALQTHALENIQDGLEPGYPTTNPMSILVKGGAYVETEDVVTPDLPVYARHTVDGGLDQLGIYAGAAGTGLSLVPNARFIKGSVVSGGKNIAVLELL